jgi:hypothetical protein
MSRRLGVVCAAALLIAAAGCSAGSFLLSFAGSGGKQQVVSGSVDDVSARLQASLKNVGILVTANQVGEDLRLQGETKSHKRFTLVLKRQQTLSGEGTAIAVEWEKDADEQFWLTVVEMLATPKRTAADSSSSSDVGR